MKNMQKKSILLLILVMTVLAASIGGTVAYLATRTNDITNTFTPANVDITVTDEVESNTKKDVVITNDSNIPVYIRVAVVANWCNDDGEVVAPWNDYGNLDVKSDKWTYKEGYYYYNEPVVAGSSVTLFKSYKAEDTPEGAHLEMDIIAQGIQAEPTDAVKAAWGFVPGAN